MRRFSRDYQEGLVTVGGGNNTIVNNYIDTINFLAETVDCYSNYIGHSMPNHTDETKEAEIAAYALESGKAQLKIYHPYVPAKDILAFIESAIDYLETAITLLNPEQPKRITAKDLVKCPDIFSKLPEYKKVDATETT